MYVVVVADKTSIEQESKDPFTKLVSSSRSGEVRDILHGILD